MDSALYRLPLIFKITQEKSDYKNYNRQKHLNRFTVYMRSDVLIWRREVLYNLIKHVEFNVHFFGCNFFPFQSLPLVNGTCIPSHFYRFVIAI